MEVEQRGDDLEVVLDPVVDLADQPGLARDRGLELGLVPGDGPGDLVEGLAELADLLRRGAQLAADRAPGRRAGRRRSPAGSGASGCSSRRWTRIQPISDAQSHISTGRKDGEDLAGADRRRARSRMRSR